MWKWQRKKINEKYRSEKSKRAKKSDYELAQQKKITWKLIILNEQLNSRSFTEWEKEKQHNLFSTFGGFFLLRFIKQNNFREKRKKLKNKQESKLKNCSIWLDFILFFLTLNRSNNGKGNVEQSKRMYNYDHCSMCRTIMYTRFIVDWIESNSFTESRFGVLLFGRNSKINHSCFPPLVDEMHWFF